MGVGRQKNNSLGHLLLHSLRSVPEALEASWITDKMCGLASSFFQDLTLRVSLIGSSFSVHAEACLLVPQSPKEKVCDIIRQTPITTRRTALTWLGLVSRHINHCWLFNAQYCFYSYIKFMICKHIFRYKVLNDKTVLFLIIQFLLECQMDLFDLLIGPYQVLPPRFRVNLGAMAMKVFSAFPKATALQEPHHQIA